MDVAIVGIGIDTASLDVSSDSYQVWLGAGRYQVENLNLEGVPESGLKFILMPLRIEGAYECSSRVMAIIN